MDACLSRFSLFGFVACGCCVVGGAMFAVCSHAAAETTLQLMQEAFHMTYYWMETFQILLTLLGCLMIALSIMVFVGSTVMGFSMDVDGGGGGGGERHRGRQKKAAAVSAKPSSRVTPMVFIGLLCPALAVWLGLFAISLSMGLIGYVIAIHFGLKFSDLNPILERPQEALNPSCS